MYNLLREQWLPAQMQNGEIRWIAPYQIGDPNILALAPGRPDFKAALMEFLVGLMQTAFAPSPRDWKKWLENPPTEEELRRAFKPHEPYFELLGERQAGRGLFMQDLTMCDADKPVRSGIDSLLLEQPGENTVKKNADLFIHRGQVESLCPACAAAALYTLQVFAPSGGKGNRTSLRGGGPLSTLLKGRNLWEDVWLNVLPYGPRPDEIPPAPDIENLAGQVYPWAAPPRTSEKGEETQPKHVHLLHSYWSTPRRLVLENVPSIRPCDLCGSQHEVAVVATLSRPYGYNYSSLWIHPLTPYTFQQDKQSQEQTAIPIKGQANSAAYSNWLGVVYGTPSEVGSKATNRMEPARCCQHREALKEAHKRNGGVNAAGYNMDNMKAVSWCEHVFPIIDVPEDEEFRKIFVQTVSDMVQAAKKAQSILAGCLKEALVNSAGKNQASIDKALFTDAANTFWTDTEDGFYRHIRQLAEQQPDSNEWQETLYAWGKTLLRAVNRIYQTVAWAGFPPERMEQRVKAQGLLNGATIKDLRNRAMYPPEQKSPKQKEKKS